MTISIVIPAFNEAKYLPNTLNSIKDSSRVFNAAGWESEIIVCDNNSTDATSILQLRMVHELFLNRLIKFLPLAMLLLESLREIG